MPKMGTPIKLLGRDDGIVDWYNLEKSSRIKSFRCGEYDECIERAKDHALHSKRKRFNTGKYVRREEAILHALELEAARSFDENQKFGSGNNSLMVMEAKNFSSKLNVFGHNKEPYVARKTNKIKKSNQKLSQSGISFENPDRLTASNMQYMQRKKLRTLNDSEDDIIDGIKRMSDFQDLRLGMVLMGEPSGRGKTNRFHDEVLPDGASLSKWDFDNDFSNYIPINSSRDSCSSLKQKQPHVGKANESLKKKCCHQSIEEAWMGASETQMPSLCYQGAIMEESSYQGISSIKSRAEKSTSKEKDPSPAIDASPDCSGTSCEQTLLNTQGNSGNAASGGRHFHSGMNDKLCPNISEFIDDEFSDRLLDVPVIGGDNAAELSPTFEISPSTNLNSGTKEDQSNIRIQVGMVSQLNEGLGEACSTSSSTQVNKIRQEIDMGASEWHAKGKRNIRCLSSNRNVNSEIIVNKTIQKEVVITSDESLTSENHDAPTNRKPKFSLVNDGNVNVCNSIACVMEMPLPPRQIHLPSRYRDSEHDGSRLYDVELNVQSNYQGRRVPLVSLMSKFNGKAIIGHPVTIEILESDRSVKKIWKDWTKSMSSNRTSSSGKKLGLSPRKIRKLSSIAVDHKNKGNGRRILVDKIGGPAVSCIPLRFSRLNEALNASARPSN